MVCSCISTMRNYAEVPAPVISITSSITAVALLFFEKKYYRYVALCSVVSGSSSGISLLQIISFGEVKKLSGENEKLSQNNETLTQNNKKLFSNIGILQKEHQESSRLNKELTKEVSSLEGVKKELESETQKLQKEFKEKNQALDALNQRYEALNTDFQKKIDQLDCLEEALKNVLKIQETSHSHKTILESVEKKLKLINQYEAEEALFSKAFDDLIQHLGTESFNSKVSEFKEKVENLKLKKGSQDIIAWSLFLDQLVKTKYGAVIQQIDEMRKALEKLATKEDCASIKAQIAALSETLHEKK